MATTVRLRRHRAPGARSSAGATPPSICHERSKHIATAIVAKYVYKDLRVVSADDTRACAVAIHTRCMEELPAENTSVVSEVDSCYQSRARTLTRRLFFIARPGFVYPASACWSMSGRQDVSMSVGRVFETVRSCITTLGERLRSHSDRGQYTIDASLTHRINAYGKCLPTMHADGWCCCGRERNHYRNPTLWSFSMSPVCALWDSGAVPCSVPARCPAIARRAPPHPGYSAIVVACRGSVVFHWAARTYSCMLWCAIVRCRPVQSVRDRSLSRGCVQSCR